METVIWIAQIVLAVAMLGAGSMKLARTRQQLLDTGNMDWAADFSDTQVKGIGALEVVAAIGLIVPAAIGVAAVLTPLAAVGVVLLMAGAGATHLRRGEGSKVPVNVVLAAIALFIAIERFGPHAL